MNQVATQPRIVRSGNLNVNLDNRSQVTVGNKRIHLTPKEFAFLQLLCLNQGITQTRGRIFQHLYGVVGLRADMEILDVFVCKLRRKLDRRHPNKYIQTIYGKGYVLLDLVE